MTGNFQGCMKGELMSTSKHLQRITSISSIFLIIFLIIGSSVYATNEQTKRNEANEAGKKANELYEKVGEAEKQIRSIQSEIDNKQAEINSTKENIEKTKGEIKTQNELLDKRLSAMYKTGNVGIIEVILSSNDVSELLTNISMVQRILSSDKKVLKELKDKNEELEKLEKDLLKQEEALESDQAEIQKIRDNYKTQADEYKVLQDQKNREADELAAQAAAAQSEYEKKLAEQRAQNSNDTSSSSSSSGGYLWPLSFSGIITSPYGWRSDPFLGCRVYHNGVDIAANMGTPVRAVADGYVTRASWYGSYGNCVIISIGNGMSTLYGHLNGFACSNGQYVKKGQVVAYIGTTGRSTGPHLHFSLFRNGADINPYTLY